MCPATWTARILTVIEAFQGREFGNSRDVLLYLKYLNSKHDGDNVRAIEKAIAGAPNIRTPIAAPPQLHGPKLKIVSLPGIRSTAWSALS